MGSATMSVHHLLHNLILRPLSTTTAPTTALSLLRRHNHHNTNPNLPLLHITRHLCTLQETNPITSQVLEEITLEEEIEETENGEKGKTVIPLQKREVPELSIKEKKELGSYAHGLGDKLKAQQIGKSGVTGNVAFALDETLEANELLKLKIHRSCPGELEDVIRQLEEATGSVKVSLIGRTVILYRPSITKLKAEEKKEQNRRVFEQKKKKFLQAPSTVQRWKKRD
ncbi:uncharacterized protein LOC141599357 [Silene latifolia]|uniref:uncharacterized protein LOC141599357 n=1 Tax=Silene latifolia TaxID=37657 RepID=UPI003D778B0F